MAKVVGAVVVDTEECKGCGLCVVACPQQVLGQNKQVNSRGYHYSFMEIPEACIGCSNCAVICPDTCITVYRVKIASSESRVSSSEYQDTRINS
jgi:2-oxoglutarate ferredoxin oxidoreductase subunit delta